MYMEIGIQEVSWLLFIAFLYIVMPSILGGNSTKSRKSNKEVDKDGK